VSWSYGGYTSENREDVEFELWCMIVLERDIYTVFWIVAYASGNSPFRFVPCRHALCSTPKLCVLFCCCSFLLTCVCIMDGTYLLGYSLPLVAPRGGGAAERQVFFMSVACPFYFSILILILILAVE